MIYLLAIFRNRTDTMAYYSILSSYRVRCSIVNTPRQALVACGVSVKFSIHDYEKALYILKRRHLSSFVGFYKVFENGSTYSVTPYI